MNRSSLITLAVVSLAIAAPAQAASNPIANRVTNYFKAYDAPRSISYSYTTTCSPLNRVRWNCTVRWAAKYVEDSDYNVYELDVRKSKSGTRYGRITETGSGRAIHS